MSKSSYNAAIRDSKVVVIRDNKKETEIFENPKNKNKSEIKKKKKVFVR